MAERLQPSGIRAVFDRALELERSGRNIVHLEIGRPHRASPEVATRAAIAALERGDVHYTPNRGTPPLREAIGSRAGRPAREVIVTSGGSEAAAAATFAVVDPGDEVIILDPAWPHYDGHVRLAGGVPVHVPCEAAEAFQPDPDRVEAAVTRRTCALIVSSPCNPTGTVIDAERIAALAGLCVTHDIVALSDEIYSDFVYDGAVHRSIAAEPGMTERTVIVDSCSKSWSMTGWRVGWAIAPPAIGDRLNAVHQHLGVCAPAFAQAGAQAAVAEGGSHTQAMVTEYADRRRALVAAIADLPSISLEMPRGAFYAFPSIEGTDPARRLLEQAGVAVVPGQVFGSAYAGHIRISYAVSGRTLDEGLARLRGFATHDGQRDRAW